MSHYKFASVSELADAAARDSALATNLQQDPVGTLRTVASALENDRWVYRIVVLGLALTLLGVVVGAIALAIMKIPVPDVLVALGSGSLGALAGLLAPSPVR